jgi:hypothetical protein
MKRRLGMEVVLFLSKLSHDHLEKDDERMMGGWLHGGMEKPTVVGNLAKALGAFGGSKHLPRILLRSEEWGGVIFDVISESVYQADKEAFEVFTALKRGETLEGLLAGTDADDRKRIEELLDKARAFSLI